MCFGAQALDQNSTRITVLPVLSMPIVYNPSSGLRTQAGGAMAFFLLVMFLHRGWRL